MLAIIACNQDILSDIAAIKDINGGIVYDTSRIQNTFVDFNTLLYESRTPSVINPINNFKIN